MPSTTSAPARRSTRVSGAAVLALALLAPLLLPHASFAGPPPEEHLIPVHVIPAEADFRLNDEHEVLDIAGMALGTQGELYVSDCALNQVHVLDLDGAHRDQFTHGTLACPRGLSVDEDGTLLIVNDTSGSVERFTRYGRHAGTLVASGVLASPQSVATQAGLVAVSDEAGSDVAVFDRSGRLLRRCGGYGTEPGSFTVPLGLDFGPDGSLYVADQQNARVQRLDPTDCSVLGLWGQWGSHAGDLAEPADVAVTSTAVYVADLTNHRLQAFDLEGDFLFQWGRHPELPGQGDGHTHYPYLIEVDETDTTAVVCEPFEVRCQVFDLDVVRTHRSTTDGDAFWNKYPQFHYGKTIDPMHVHYLPIEVLPDGSTACIQPCELVFFRGVAISEPDVSEVAILDWTHEEPSVHATLGGFGTELGKFRQPAGVALDEASGELFVADGNNHRIQVFSFHTGQVIREFGNDPQEPEQMSGPGRIAFDASGNLLVAEVHGHRISIWTKQGDFVGAIGSHGDGPLEFNRPLSVRFDPQLQRIYVVDTFNARVQILHADGRWIGEFGTYGLGPGEFVYPFDVGIDGANNLYVTDTASNRVKKFDASGQFLHQWGSWGSEPGEFYKPKGVAVLEDKVLVIDFGNHRGQIFDDTGTPLGIFGEGVLSPVADELDGIFQPVVFAEVSAVSGPDSGGGWQLGPLLGLVALVGGLGFLAGRRRARPRVDVEP